MHRARALAATVGVALAVGCSGGGGGSDVTAPPPPPPTSTSNAIDVADNSYSPNATIVPPGTTVTWTWKGVNPHDVLFADGTRSVVQRTGTYARQFAVAGVYNYSCSVHGAAMSGRVTVQ